MAAKVRCWLRLRTARWSGGEGACRYLGHLGRVPCTGEALRRPVGGTAGVLAGLPVSALRLDPDTVADLRKLGFERICDLEATPRAPLTLRFGPGVCRRLDQALGRVPEPIEPIRPADVVEVRRVFAEPIAAGAHASPP